jgi:hypothetical protein
MRGRGAVAGAYVRLVPGEAREEYDLELAHLVGASKKRAATPWDELRQLDVTSAAAIEGFVGRWGLLGLVFEERWVRTTLADRENVARRYYPLCPGLDTESARFLRSRWDGDDPERLFFPEDRLRKEVDAWERMAEPLSLFRTAVREFQATARSAARWSQRPVAPPFPLLERSLREHTMSVRPDLRFRPGVWGEYEATWSLAYPSLLVCCYDKLRVQLAGGVLRYCPVCWCVFAAPNARQVYCPEGCKNVAKCRRRRGKDHGAA